MVTLRPEVIFLHWLSISFSFCRPKGHRGHVEVMTSIVLLILHHGGYTLHDLKVKKLARNQHTFIIIFFSSFCIVFLSFCFSFYQVEWANFKSSTSACPNNLFFNINQLFVSKCCSFSFPLFLSVFMWNFSKSLC